MLIKTFLNGVVTTIVRDRTGYSIFTLIFVHVSPPAKIGALIEKIYGDDEGSNLPASLSLASLAKALQAWTSVEAEPAPPESAKDYLKELEKAGKDGDAMTQEQFAEVVKVASDGAGPGKANEAADAVKTWASKVWADIVVGVEPPRADDTGVWDV